MFNDLPDNKAIRMGDVFIVKLANIYGLNNFELNGVRAKGGLHTLPNLDNIYSVKAASKQLSHYALGDEVIGTALFNSKNPYTYYDDDYEEYQFDSLEHEFEIKKEWERVNNATPIYDETPEELIPVEIEVIGSMVDTGSKFISTPYQLGRAFFNSSGGIYSLTKYQIACDEVGQVIKDYPDAKIDLPTHSGLQYLKVNGGYIFTHSPEPWIRGNSVPLILTCLDDAKAEEKKIRGLVRSRMMVEIKLVAVDNVTIRGMYKFIESVKSTLSEIEVKQKSSSKRSGLNNRLAEKLKELEQIVNK